MTSKRNWLGWLHCLMHGHVWVRPPYHGHLVSLNDTLQDLAARPVCKGSCTRCGKSDCEWNRR